MKKMVLALVTMTVLITLTGCETVGGFLQNGYKKKEDVEKQIADLEAKHKQELETKVKDVQTNLEKTIKAQDNQLQEGANKLYIANEAFRFYTKPTRLDYIVNNRITEAQTVIGKGPTLKAMQEENQRLKDELDENKTSLEELKNKHNQVLSELGKLVKETEQAKKDAETSKAALEESKKKYEVSSKELQEKLKQVNDDLQKEQEKKANNAEAIERMKTKLMIGCGIAAAICIIATIYSPVGKASLAVAAMVFGGSAAAIPYIEGWMILLAAIVIVAIITVIFLYNHYVADKTTDNLINHIQDLKEDPTIPEDLKNHIKKSLSKWNSKYVDGKITMEDASVEKYIKSKLKDYGRL